MWPEAFCLAPFQSWCQLGVALCSIRFGGQRSGQNLGEEVEWREAMELPSSHTSSLFGRMRLPAGAKKHAPPSRSPRKMWNVSHSFRVLHPSVKRVIIGWYALCLWGISPTHFASFPHQVASSPHQICFISPTNRFVSPTVCFISPTDRFISPTQFLTSPTHFVSLCQT